MTRILFVCHGKGLPRPDLRRFTAESKPQYDKRGWPETFSMFKDNPPNASFRGDVDMLCFIWQVSKRQSC